MSLSTNDLERRSSCIKDALRDALTLFKTIPAHVALSRPYGKEGGRVSSINAFVNEVERRKALLAREVAMVISALRAKRKSRCRAVGIETRCPDVGLRYATAVRDNIGSNIGRKAGAVAFPWPTSTARPSPSRETRAFIYGPVFFTRDRRGAR